MMAENSRKHGSSRFADELGAALDWWRDAGVDTGFSDEPIDRLAEAAAEREHAVPAPTPAVPPLPISDGQTGAHSSAQPQQIGGEPSAWPSDLATFRQWWMDDPSVEAGGTGPRIAPRGAGGAELMVLVAQPGPEDRENLLEWRHGQLLAAFLRAAGVDENGIYLASALPRSIAMPDWAGLQARGLGELAKHHVALAAPRRLLILSRNILPLMGHDMAQGPHLLTREHGMTRDVPVLAAAGLEELLRSGKRRQRLWQDWLDWTAD